MAAGVSSSSRPAYLHHHNHHHHHYHQLNQLPLSTPSGSSSGSSSASSSSNNSSSLNSLSSATNTSPLISALSPTTTISTTTLTLPTSASDFDHSCRSLSPNSTTTTTTTTSNSSSAFSTPATSPLPYSPLDPVAESESSSPSSPASTNSVSYSRLRPLQPQPSHQSSGNHSRGESKSQKSGGFFAFAASAIDRTQSAIATISDPSVLHKRSLSRLSITSDAAAYPRGAEPSPEKPTRYRPASIVSSSSSANLLSPLPTNAKFPSSQINLAQEAPFSQPYSATDPSQPPPILLPRVDNKMHQTSSRLLRMTDDDRPFTKVSNPTM